MDQHAEPQHTNRLIHETSLSLPSAAALPQLRQVS